MNPKMLDEIKSRMNQKTSEELAVIWSKNDRREWSDEAFEAIRLILAERGVSVAAQNLPPDVEKQQAATAQMDQLPSIPYRKALNLDLNFRSWTAILTLWVVFGFFWLGKEYSDYENYSKALANIRMASSPFFSVKPEFADTVKRLGKHLTQLENLKGMFALSGFVSLAAWVCTIFVRRQFQRKTATGPKMLLGLLCGMLAFDIICAVSTLGIPGSEVRDLVDVYQIRMIPFVRIFLIIAVLPFFSKLAPLYYQYVGIGRDVFSRVGAAWRFLTPTEIVARVAKLNDRRRRSGYAAWAFLVAAAVLIGTLIVTKADMPAAVRLAIFIPAALVIIWTIIESTLLASVLFSSSAAVLLGGILTYGIVSCLVILFLRRKVTKELALAPAAESGVNTTANQSVEHYVSSGADAG